MTAINRWILSVLDIGPDIEHCQYRTVNIWYNQNYTVFGVNPNPGGQAPGDNNVVTLHDLGNGTIALQCGGGYNAFASLRDDYGYQVQFQAPYSARWITGIGGDEILQVIPTGDGYFALYSPTFRRYVTVDSGPDTAASNCYPLRGTTGDIRQAARFTAAGQDHLAVLDFVRTGKNASGLSFAGANLSNVGLSGGNDLTGCDFRRIAHGSLSGCVLDGAKLQDASFAGLHLDGLSISNADCTHADFTGCDFTSFVPHTLPPVLAGADLTGGVIPEGNSWSGANMPSAVLAEATLTGSDLSGASTTLTGANLSGVGVTLFGPTYQGGGIGGYNLTDPADRIIAFDCNSTGYLDHLVCYRPGTGIIFILRKNSDGTFHPVYQSGVPANGIGGSGGCNLSDPNDRIIAYDFAGTGNLDHLVCYRPGARMIWIIEKKTDSQNKVTFDPVWYSTSGIDGCDLSNPNDRIIAFDYYGTGHLDHLVCYRVGTGNIWILEKDTDQNNKVTFTPVFSSTSGIGGYLLGSLADRIIAFDGDSTPGQPKLNYLVCYRPGRGALFVIRKNTDGTFGSVYAQGDPGNGVGGYTLGVPSDQVFAYDYEGTGHLDHLVCYRPGTGNIWILKKETDQNNNMTFTPVYRRFGIGDYDLAVLDDRIIAYDNAGTGRLDHLICYRPGAGTIWVIQSRPARPATLERCNLAGANLSNADLTGLDLTKAPSLKGANLSGTQLAGAKLAGVNLTGANLAGTNFTGTDLTEVTFSFPLIRSADANHPTIFASCKLPYAVIGLDWSYIDLTAATITGLPTDLTGLLAVSLRLPCASKGALGDFTSFVLDRANFTGATLDGANFADAKLRQKPSFANARLTGAYFTGAVLDQANFAGAALGGIKSTPAANFSSAWISNCNFTQANAYGVNFAGATLISGNTLTGATSLQESDFSNAYLPFADFTNANLQGAIFDGACMVGCVLAHADLTPAEEGAKTASLYQACLQGVDFTGTKLMGANLNNAAISNGNGQIPVSHYDENGKLIGPEPMFWRAKNFPSEAAFSDATVCPNGRNYGSNMQHGLSLAQMMEAQNPPTQWTPPTAAKLSTTTTLNSNNNPSANGQQVTFQAQVGSVSTGTGVPTGTVNFVEGSNSLGSADLISGTAAFPISSLAEGTHTIQAAYQGDNQFAPSHSAPLTQIVAKNFVTPTVDLTVNGSSAGATVSVGDTVTFGARIHAAANCPWPNGSITISDRSGNSYGTADNSKDPNSNDGVATITNSGMAAGSYTLVATYGGDGGNYYNGAQSNTVSLEIKPRASRK
jgi:uncharacterized protein YjbI with pentapeptide repeats